MKLAHNRCWGCKTEWHDYPGAFAQLDPNQCPKCGGLYWDWLNYSEFDLSKAKPQPPGEAPTRRDDGRPR